MCSSVNGGSVARSPAVLDHRHRAAQPTRRTRLAEQRGPPSLLNTSDGSRRPAVRAAAPAAGRERHLRQLRRSDGARPALLPCLRHPPRRSTRAGLAAGRRAGRPAPAAGGRPADVSPLAAVIGIALLGGMLLIGVLIGRGDSDDQRRPLRSCRSARAARPDAEHRHGVRRRRPDDAEHRDERVAGRAPTGTRSSSARSAKVERHAGVRRRRQADGARRAARRTRRCSTPTCTRACRPGNYIVYSGVYDTARRPSRRSVQLGDSVPRTRGDRGLRRRASAGASSRPAIHTSAPTSVASTARRRIPSDRALVPGAEPAVSRSRRNEPERDRAAQAVLQDPAAPAAGAGRARRPADPGARTPPRRRRPLSRPRPRGSGSRSDRRRRTPAKPQEAPWAATQAARSPPRRLRRPPRLRSPRRRPKPSRRRPRPPRRPVAAQGAPQADAGLLASRREQLAREFAELQSDLGGLVYEMAMRDEFRPELVARQAAKLQAVDLELSAVERALGIASSDPGRQLPVVRQPGAARRRVLRPVRRAAHAQPAPGGVRPAVAPHPGPAARRPPARRARPVGGAAGDSRADPGRHSRSDPELAGPGPAGAGR